MNPIRSVRPVGTPASQAVTVRTPSAYRYKLQDVSEADAGRTADATMHKKKIGSLRGIELEWWNIDTPTVSDILQKFQSEYLIVEFWDALSGTWKESTFYVGDRSVPMYSGILDIWSNLSFNLIEQEVF